MEAEIDPACFSQTLRQLLNSFSRENSSNTPDFVLAAYLERCLDAFNDATLAREQFYGVHHMPDANAATPLQI